MEESFVKLGEANQLVIRSAEISISREAQAWLQKHYVEKIPMVVYAAIINNPDKTIQLTFVDSDFADELARASGSVMAASL